MTPALVGKLTTLAENVCGVIVRRKKRQETLNSCAYDFVNEASVYPELSDIAVYINRIDVADFIAEAAAVCTSSTPVFKHSPHVKDMSTHYTTAPHSSACCPLCTRE